MRSASTSALVQDHGCVAPPTTKGRRAEFVNNKAAGRDRRRPGPRTSQRSEAGLCSIACRPNVVTSAPGINKAEEGQESRLGVAFRLYAALCQVWATLRPNEHRDHHTVVQSARRKSAAKWSNGPPGT